MSVVLDVQGFRGNNKEFIIKEISIVELNKRHVIHAFCKEPYNINELSTARRIEARWLIRNYHGINWTYGHVAYEEIGEVLKSALLSYNTIYVKGCEKKKILEVYLSSLDSCKFKIFDIDYFHIESLKRMRIDEGGNKCFYHQNLKSSFMCSYENAYNLANIVIQNQDAEHGDTTRDEEIHLSECTGNCFCL